MIRTFFALGVLVVAAGICAQSVTTGSDEEDSALDPVPLEQGPFDASPLDGLQLSSPAPLLTFVSPDTSLVARPGETPLPLPSPSATPLMHFEIQASADPDAAKPTTDFRTNTPHIFVRWHGDNMRPGALVRVAWVAEDVREVIDPGFVVDQHETMVETPSFGGRFTISRPSDGWAPGKYRVDVFVDDELKDTLSVTIRD